MRRVLYISTAKTDVTKPMIDDILLTARRKNEAAGVTGLLVSGGRRFLQALEGPEDAVEAIYQSILKDPRHFAMVKLSDKPIDSRAFADWSMGYQPGADAPSDWSLQQQVAFIVAPLEDANLRAYFTGFVERHSS